MNVAADAFLIAALVCSMAFNVPQLRQTWTTRDTRALSTYTIVLRIVTQSMWIGYGAFTSQWILIGVTIQNILSEIILLVCKLMWPEPPDPPDPTVRV